MSDWINSFVSTTGPVQAGGGDLYAFSISMLADSRGRTPRARARDELVWLRSRFVLPGGYARARDILEAHRVVFLDGEPGSGRNTAGWMLLYGHHSGVETFHELSSKTEDETRRLDPDHVEEHGLLSLDLSDVEERDWRDTQEDLYPLIKAVRERAARLVVVLPHDRVRAGEFRADLDRYRAGITHPPAREVLRRYLREGGIPGIELDFSSPELSDFLNRGRPVRDVARFAGIVLEARERSQEGERFAAWCENALAVMTRAVEQIAGLLAKAREGPQRALLLTTAMLHGAHADAVYHGAASLLRVTKHPEDERKLLEREDLAERLKDIEVEADVSGRVRFAKVEQDFAIRTHFWRHVPDLRVGLCDWVGETVRSTELDPEDRDRLVQRLAEQCLNDRYRGMLVKAVYEWGTSPPDPHRLRAAAMALEKGLREEEHGRFFRKQVYDWSREGQLPVMFAQLLVVMCREVIAVRHPDEAVVRLHHLARRERTTTYAWDTLVGLARGKPQLHRLMLDRLNYQLAVAEKKQYLADTGLFLELADPVSLTASGDRRRSLIAESAVRRWLTGCWKGVFRSPPEVWSSRTGDWLVAASRDGRHREALLDVLVEGGEGHMDILSRLYITARDLARSATPEEREDRALLVKLLRRRIDAVIGIPGGRNTTGTGSKETTS
ncbi:hypothetical protein ACFY19_01130 [Streptosporangium saharense]|uniref:nSTAND3 domain-containing NTPase n=1 Tax=Streptosporangium saharense TaxID=1706840 RepID=UPI0036B0D07C